MALGAVAMFCGWLTRVGSNTWLEAFVRVVFLDVFALIPTLTLPELLAVIVSIDAYIHPDLKRTMRVIIAGVFTLVHQKYWGMGLSDSK